MRKSVLKCTKTDSRKHKWHHITLWNCSSSLSLLCELYQILYFYWKCKQSSSLHIHMTWHKFTVIFDENLYQIASFVSWKWMSRKEPLTMRNWRQVSSTMKTQNNTNNRICFVRWWVSAVKSCWLYSRGMRERGNNSLVTNERNSNECWKSTWSHKKNRQRLCINSEKLDWVIIVLFLFFFSIHSFSSWKRGRVNGATIAGIFTFVRYDSFLFNVSYDEYDRFYTIQFTCHFSNS